jgi:chromosomal replication initiator protein
MLVNTSSIVKESVSNFDGLPETGEWDSIKSDLRYEIGDAAYNNWIAPLIFDKKEFHTGFIAAPTRFIRDWVATNYIDRIRLLWNQRNKAIEDVKIIISDAPLNAAPQPKNNVIDLKPQENVDDDKDLFHPDRIGVSLDPKMTFDNFVVGKPNELAFAAAQRVAECSTPSFNPLFLYGGVGLGKTHLMHAIANKIKQTTPERTVLYLSAEKFMYQFVRALRYKNIVSFKEHFRNVHVLMIDDVQFISGKDSTQEEFFHTFNALVDQNHQIIISADKSPSDLEGMEERLRSRLGWGLVADIHPTNFELRLSILESKAELQHMKIPNNVLELLAHKITSNVRELEGALNRVIAHSTLVGREINLDMTKEVLTDLFRSFEKNITIDEIQKDICRHFNIKLSDLHSGKRSREIARPRQIAMYFSKHLTTNSLPAIGRKFGGRDHSTVLHAVRKVEDLIQKDTQFAEDIDLLRRKFEN